MLKLPWHLCASTLILLARTPPTTSFEILEAENGCVELARKDMRQEVGKACVEVTSSKQLRIRVAVETNECVLANVKLWNLPGEAKREEIIDAKSFTFEIEEDVVHEHLCREGEESMEGWGFNINDRKFIIGETSTECLYLEDGGDVEKHEEFFRISYTCESDGSLNASTQTSSSELDSALAAEPISSVSSASEISSSASEISSSASEISAATVTTVDPSTTRNFHLHIPKAGGSSTREFAKQLFTEILGSEEQGRVAFCGTGGGMWDDPTGEKWLSEQTRRHCLLVSGEHDYSAIPQRTFTIMREPKSHVLSMYFHCLESEEGKKRREAQGHPEPYVPPLDEFLERWVNVKRGTRFAPIEYRCYDPVNMQHKWFNKPEGKEELRARFEVIGILSSLTTSVCLEIISLTGKVPKSCDCTGAKNDEIVRRRRLDATLRDRTLQDADSVLVDHGVIHHGGTYEPTPEQNAMLEELTDLDRALYEDAKELFAEQVKQVEEAHGVELCGK